MFEKRKAYANEPKKVNLFFQVIYFACVVAIIYSTQQYVNNTWLMIVLSSAASMVFTFFVWLIFPRYSLFGTKMSEDMRIRDKLVMEQIKKNKERG